MIMFGIDVSHYQENIDWGRVKSTCRVEFAIIKAMYETSKRADETFEKNYTGCTNYDISRGVYNFIGRVSASDPVADANAFLKILNGRKLEMGIWLDVESKNLRSLGKEKIESVILKETEIFESAGYKVGIYCNLDWYKNVITDKIKKAFEGRFWIARYPKADNGTYNENSTLSPKSFAVAWQYSSKGKVDGIKGNVDMDVLFVPIEEVFGKKVEDMKVVIGSARIDENGKLTGGKAGDQTGREVSTQKFYMHSKGWIGLRAKDSALADKLAKGMQIACDNPNLGYDQNERLGVVRNGIESTVKTECDCSSLVRAVLKYAGVEVTNFTTATEKAIIMATGLFDEVKINSAADVTNGMILVTKTKGHTVIVVSGATEKKEEKKSNPYTPSRITLFKGSAGNNVRWLQTELNNRGYNCGKVDGSFGDKTEKAVKAFQKANGLKQDGICGPKTLAKLY